MDANETVVMRHITTDTEFHYIHSHATRGINYQFYVSPVNVVGEGKVAILKTIFILVDIQVKQEQLKGLYLHVTVNLQEVALNVTEENNTTLCALLSGMIERGVHGCY